MFKVSTKGVEDILRPRKSSPSSSSSSGCGVNMETEVVEVDLSSQEGLELAIIRARRTAFVARFIVLRESKRTRAHRAIELMEWVNFTTVEELATRFRAAFVANGDNMVPVDRDLRRAFAHSHRSLKFFITEYSLRSTRDFIEALEDYERSNELLFGLEDQPKPGGWRLPLELRKLKQAKGVIPTKRGAKKDGASQRQ